MHCFLSTLIDWFTTHPKISVTLGYIGAAGVNTAPRPGAPVSGLTIYTWLYDWAGAILPQKAHSSLPVPPTPSPIPKAQE
jgi:hypothetical protein